MGGHILGCFFLVSRNLEVVLNSLFEVLKSFTDTGNVVGSHNQLYYLIIFLLFCLNFFKFIIYKGFRSDCKLLGHDFYELIKLIRVQSLRNLLQLVLHVLEWVLTKWSHYNMLRANIFFYNLLKLCWAPILLMLKVLDHLSLLNFLLFQYSPKPLIDLLLGVFQENGKVLIYFWVKILNKLIITYLLLGKGEELIQS